MFRHGTIADLFSKSTVVALLVLAASTWCWADAAVAAGSFDFGAAHSSSRSILGVGPRADNTPHGMAVSLADNGFRLESLAPGTPWLLSFDVKGYGRGELVQPPASIRPTVQGPNAELRPTASVVLDLLNGAEGLQLDFVLETAPPGAASAPGDPIHLELALGGDVEALPDEVATALNFARRGELVARMALVSATDAAGLVVPARWESTADAENAPGATKLVLDAAGMTYPIHVAFVAGAPKLLRAAAQEATAPAPPPLHLDKVRPPAAPTTDGQPAAPAPAGFGDAGAFAAPPNDDCANAISIPTNQFPVLTATQDVMDATANGDPTAVCSVIDSTIWYTFSPAITAKYSITDCAASGASGTTMPDTVISVYNASGGCAAPGNYVGCNDTDLACTSGNPPDQSTVTALLIAGNTYYIVAGRYSGVGAIPKTTGFTNIQLKVDKLPPPSNDTCTAPTTLNLNEPLVGSTVSANNDYQTLSDAACYSGVGQTLTTAPGGDVVYRFTAPSAGKYSFRVTNYAGLMVPINPVLYMASDCPTTHLPATVTCLAGANRSFNGTNTAEEVMCQPLTAGQIVYLFVDDQNAIGATSYGVDFVINATPCTQENEPANNNQATADALACPIEGSANPAGDVDYFSLGTPPVGDRVFAQADTVAANSTDFDLRITTATDTLEYDDQDNTPAFGQLGPNVAGTPLTGVPSYIRMNRKSSTAVAEPYRLYSVVEPPLASAATEVEPNDQVETANFAFGNYFYGATSAGSYGDLDLYRFCANKGDLIYLGVDGDPLRNNTPFDPALYLLNSEGLELYGGNDANSASNTTPGTGNLTSTTPNSPGEGMSWRARYSGTYFAGVAAASATTGDYLLAIAPNCRTGAQQSSDIGVTMTSSPQPVGTFSPLTYTITVTNNGPNTGIGTVVTDVIPAGTTFQSVAIVGLTGDWHCTTPAVGGTGTVTCQDFCSLYPSQSVLQLVVKVNQCIGSGVVINNTVTVSSTSSDPNPANNAASTTNTTTETGQCSNADLCTTNDYCVGSTCVGGTPVTCNDGIACTVDSCNPATGCVFTPNNSLCSDGVACTVDTCTYGVGCSHTPYNSLCDDGNLCTIDTCNATTGCQYAPEPDTDRDGYCDPADCAPTDNQVWKAPTEVANVVFPSPATNKTNMSWTSQSTTAGPATRYDVVRGSVGNLPVGGTGETCVEDNLATPVLVDAITPGNGAAFYYLVRAENVCAIGVYGTQSNGTPRNTTSCLP